MFLTGRAEGAETAFFELLRLRPESRLDPQTTRPDAVAFFEQVRLRYAEPLRAAARASNRKTFAWNLLPPAGQLQNGYTARAITIGGIELAALGTAITSFVLLKQWEGPNHTFPGREDQASATRIVNWTSVGVLCAAFIVGVIDGIAHYSEPQDDTPNTTTTATTTTMTTPTWTPTTTASTGSSPPGSGSSRGRRRESCSRSSARGSPAPSHRPAPGRARRTATSPGRAHSPGRRT